MRWVTGLVGLTLAVGQAVPAAAQPGPGPVDREIERLIGGLRASGSLAIEGETVSASHVTLQVYERRGFAALWSRWSDRAALLRTVSGVHADGLDPDVYHRGPLTEHWAVDLEPQRAARLDLLATDALVRLSYDLRFGRGRLVDGAGLVDGSGPFGGADPAGDLLEVLASGALERRVDELRPTHFAYRGLRRGLLELRVLERAGGWEPIPGGPTLQRDAADPRVPLLRRRLTLSGDLARRDPTQGEGPDEALFDHLLEGAVRAFQHRHGLTEDGRVGDRTLEALNVPVETRIEQVRVSLERARRGPREMPEAFLTVNVAAARVYLVRSQTVAFEARVVVGKDETRTPVFDAPMRYIELNPSWTVPEGMVEEVLDAVRGDARYLQDRRMHVLDSTGRRVDASTLDFSAFTPEDFPYVFYQEPGPTNPLGRLKLIFPNSYSVYLHDSPERTLFTRERRLFSHGCIRVEDPVGLAVQVLDQPATWTRDALEAAIRAGETRRIALAGPLMVQVAYQTAEVDPGGTLHFYPDVYGRDPAVLAALDAR